MTVLLILAGAVLVAGPVVAGLLGYGTPGIGTNQILLTAAGLALLTIGALRQLNLGWRQALAVSEAPVSPVRLLSLACWLGLLTGFGEDILMCVAHWLIDRGLSFNPHWFWMKPLANLVLFGLLGAVLLLMSCAWRKLGSVRVVTFTLVAIASHALLLMIPGMAGDVVFLLSIAVAVQAARAVGRHPDRFHARVGRTLPWAVGLAGVLCVATFGWRALPGQVALSNLPEPKPGSPNVLLLVMDTVRAKSLSLHGYHRATTPQIDRFASQGVRFESALTTSPWTLPSHASMFTGRFPHQIFAEGDTPITGMVQVPAEHVTLAEHMSQHGYSTAGFVANMRYCSRAHGLDRGFLHYDDYQATFEWFLNSSSLGGIFARAYRAWAGDYEYVGRKQASDINRAFLDWIEDGDQRPFFAFLNYFDAHNPYLPPPPFELKFGSASPEIPMARSKVKSPPAELAALRDAYESCIAYLDDAIGRLLEELGTRGVLENTLVIITSDHGEQFGEHDFKGHGNTLYRQLLHVPLVIAMPSRVPGGASFKAPVSLRSLPATVLDILELDGASAFPGGSLARFWKPDATPLDEAEDPVFSELILGDVQPTYWHPSWPVSELGLTSLVAEGHHYIRYRKNGDVVEELYDFDGDGEEERDLGRSEATQALRRRLGESLDRVRSGRH